MTRRRGLWFYAGAGALVLLAAALIAFVAAWYGSRQVHTCVCVTVQKVT